MAASQTTPPAPPRPPPAAASTVSETPHRTDAESTAKVAGAETAQPSWSSPSSSAWASHRAVSERIRTALELKAKGNAAFEEGDARGALTHWHQALLHCSGIDELYLAYGTRGRGRATPGQVAEAVKLHSALLLNLSACYSAQERWEKALWATEKVLIRDAKNRKALYRRARALMALGRNQEAALDIDAALELAPDDQTVRSLAETLVVLEEQRLRAEAAEAGGGGVVGGVAASIAGMAVYEEGDEAGGGGGGGGGERRRKVRFGEAAELGVGAAGAGGGDAVGSGTGGGEEAAGARFAKIEEFDAES